MPVISVRFTVLHKRLEVYDKITKPFYRSAMNFRSFIAVTPERQQ